MAELKGVQMESRGIQLRRKRAIGREGEKEGEKKRREKEE